MNPILIIPPSISLEIRKKIRSIKTVEKNNNKLIIKQKKNNKKKYDRDYHHKNRDRILEYQRHRYQVKKLEEKIFLL
jgi:Zn-finger nucleic acid-binding protein